jgi:hypothetical protein
MGFIPSELLSRFRKEPRRVILAFAVRIASVLVGLRWNERWLGDAAGIAQPARWRPKDERLQMPPVWGRFSLFVILFVISKGEQYRPAGPPALEPRSAGNMPPLKRNTTGDDTPRYKMAELIELRRTIFRFSR